jgi:hypothetical protein
LSIRRNDTKDPNSTEKHQVLGAVPNSFRRSGKVVGFLFSSCCSHDRAICFYQQGSGPFDDIFLAARGRWGVSVENVAWCCSQQHVSGQAAHLAHVVRCQVLHQSSGTAAHMLQRRSPMNGNYHLIVGHF